MTDTSGETTGATTGGTTGDKPPPTVETVEAMVRAQMAASLGGRRGIVEAAIPGVLFTVIWLATKDIRLALVVGGAGVAIALVARLIQRSTPQYVFNAAFSIAIGYLFTRIAANAGGDASDQALAYFLPGILFSLGYTVVFGTSTLFGWPLVGFMLGSVTGDPLAWHEDKQVVKLCSRLTWVLLAPGAIGVLLQGPVWLLGWSGTLDKDTAVVIVGVLRLGLGWALRIASWSLIIWLLARDATPLETRPEPEPEADPA
ncbi:DUF3159 domain-containing protein [Nocardioides anomalus]|uniref:DUF3159 domain-containing protein n=1 Tax=Nocardioides anomalus TaxID=2712223 RepID=A0A6G6WCB9_9ACTN|nr:DUF3159 domain-containing protein [Nocardioides anomalus]QIG42874.1 DUF3159 domain-containing protein [Nocardioides anomalus]